MHLHPEHGMMSLTLMDAHRDFGIANGKYESERARLGRAQAEVTRLLKAESIASKALRDFKFPDGVSSFAQAQYALLKLEAEHVVDSLVRARREARAATEALWQARLHQSRATAQLIRLRWWDHVKQKIQL